MPREKTQEVEGQEIASTVVTDARVIAIRWEPQEEGMMSTAASFPSVRNQGLIGPVGEECRF